MAKRYSLSEARTHLAEIVRAVERGGMVHLTRRGKPVAVVISMDKLAEVAGGHTPFDQAYAAFVAERQGDAER